MSDNPYKFIVIEGLDGVGKTTVARGLASRIDGVFIETPLADFRALRSQFNPGHNLESRFLFYLAAVAHASDSIRHELTTRHVVCARYVASSVAYHRALGARLIVDVDSINLVRPHYSFLLTANESERNARLVGRGRKTAEDSLLDEPNTRDRVLGEYRRWRLQEIDTTSLTIEDVIDHVCNLAFAVPSRPRTSVANSEASRGKSVAN